MKIDDEAISEVVKIWLGLGIVLGLAYIFGFIVSILEAIGVL